LENQVKTEQIAIGAYRVTLTVDDDGHLSIFVGSTDGSSPINVTDDMAGRGEVSIRVSTRLIETKAQEAEEGAGTAESASELPKYLREFPAFGVLDVAIPEGFEDTSWHNNACPTWAIQKGNGNYLVLAIDYADPEHRDTPSLKRFRLHLYDTDMNFQGDVLQTDDYAEVQNLLAIYGKAMPKFFIDRVAGMTRDAMNTWYFDVIGYKPDEDAVLTLDEIALQTAEMMYYHAGGEETLWRDANAPELWQQAMKAKALADAQEDAAKKFVVYSANESATGSGAGFWSNTEGWAELAQATRFTEAEKDSVSLPQSVGQDAKWIPLEEASKHYG
jgi:hypothetical protein